MPADWSTIGLVGISWGATYLVHSTLLVAAVWAFLRIRNSSGYALRETLWKTALIGGIVTTPLQMLTALSGPLGTLTFAVGEARQAARENAPATLNLRESLDDSVGQLSAVPGGTNETTTVETVPDFWIATVAPHREMDAAAAAPVAQSGASGALKAQPSLGGSWLSGIHWIWIPGAVAAALVAVAVGLTRYLWQSLSLARRIARCQPIEDGLARRLLDDLRGMLLRAPSVRLLSSPDDSEPAAFGVRQWTIVLPERAAVELPEEELRALLAHELAHLVRGDSFWLWISRVVCSCLAFQPLNQLARREWQRAAEFLCDNWAVSRTRAPLALARCLAEIAGWRMSGQASEAILAATGRRPGLVDRIDRLLDARPVGEAWTEHRQRQRFVVAGSAVLALLAWGAPRVQLAVARPDSRTNTQHAVRSAETADQTGQDEGAVRAGESLPESGSRLEAPIAQTAETNMPKVESPANPGHENPAGSATDLASLMKSLDEDLQALSMEIRSLEPLLLNGNPDAAMVAAVERLRAEMKRLAQKRAALRSYRGGMSK